jgi:hypothetical protein
MGEVLGAGLSITKENQFKIDGLDPANAATHMFRKHNRLLMMSARTDDL